MSVEPRVDSGAGSVVLAGVPGDVDPAEACVHCGRAKHQHMEIMGLGRVCPIQGNTYSPRGDAEQMRAELEDLRKAYGELKIQHEVQRRNFREVTDKYDELITLMLRVQGHLDEGK